MKGGGWFLLNTTDKTITFYGDSYDYGAASLEDITKAILDDKIGQGVDCYPSEYISRFEFYYKPSLGCPSKERIK